MGDNYVRQNTYTDGDVIQAADTNEEFNQLVAAFAASGGHSHNGGTGEGGPITKLLSNTLTFGDGSTDADIVINFDANGNDGTLTWKEDEQYFEFSNSILVASTEKLQFRDTAIYINSSTDGQLDLIADGAVLVDTAGDITLDAGGGDIFFKDDGTTFGSATNSSGNLIIKSGTTTALTFSGANATFAGTVTIGSAEISEAELEILDGATVTTDELNILDGVTSTATELNILDGVTSTTAELNILDGVTSTAAELNILDGVTSTATELNLLDGSSANSVVNSKAVIYGSSGELAGTLSTAAQTNITSVGTLSALTVDDVAVDGKVITLTGSTSDTATITAGTNGTLEIVTTDDAGAAGNIQITADGTAELAGTTVTLDSSGGITLDADGGTITFADAGSSLGTITSSGYTGNVVGNVSGSSGSTTGNAATATALETARTIGGVSFNGTANIDLLATDIKIGEDNETKIDFETANEIHFYAANAEQVYVADGIFGPQTDSDVDLGTTGVRWKDAYIDTITTTGAITVGGDLTVNGTTTTVNSTTVTVDDPIFTLGGDTAPGSDDNKDRGIEFRYHTGSAAKVGFFGFDDSAGKFTFIPDATNSSEVFSGTAGTIVANLEGNVTGNTSGTAATVTGAAQSNITSLGTLTTLTVDNVIVNGTNIGHTDDTDLIALADGVVTVAGEVSMTTLDIGGTNVGSTAAELNLLDGSAKSTSSITVADSDALIIIDGTTTKQIPASDIKTYAAGSSATKGFATAMAIAL